MAFGLVLVLASLWASAALLIDIPVSWLRLPLATVYVLGLSAGWVWLKSWWRGALLTTGAFIIVTSWWLTLQPSNNRDWQPDQAVLASADIASNTVSLHNIRNCRYRTETDFDVSYYDKKWGLDQIRTADLYMIYWGSPNIAHTMVSFGFTDGEYVCFSIETRKEKGESYSAIRGLFRQYELIYVVADEKDVVRLRANYRRGEEVYLFRLNGSPAQVRALFLDYLRRLNELRERPEWYSALTQNCTTSIRTQRAASERAPWDWRMLANGRGDELLYERGLINTNLPLPVLKRRAQINASAKLADADAEFSRLIRKGVPGIEPGAL